LVEWESSFGKANVSQTTAGELAMRKPIMVGCDLHDRTMLLKLARELERPQTMSVKNTSAGRRAMIAKLLTIAEGDGIAFAYEASGQGFGLHDELTAAGISCFVLAPTKIIRSQQQQRQKTDEKDALDLLELLRGHLLAGNRLPKVWIPDLQTRDDRELVRTRLNLSDKLTAVKTQIKSLLKRHGVICPAGVSQNWTRCYQTWLHSVSSEPERGAGLRGALASLLRQRQSLDDEIEALDEELLRLAATARHVRAVAELVKLRGVGLLTALVFLCEVGDLSRFENRRQISAYLGLAPCSHESGQCHDRKGHITRQGPARVRRVLCQAAWSRARGEGEGASRYRRLVEKNPKRKKIAVVAVMRQLAVLMWHRGKEGLGGAPPTPLDRWETRGAPAG
jgi:transposase